MPINSCRVLSVFSGDIYYARFCVDIASALLFLCDYFSILFSGFTCNLLYSVPYIMYIVRLCFVFSRLGHIFGFGLYSIHVDSKGIWPYHKHLSIYK